MSDRSTMTCYSLHVNLLYQPASDLQATNTAQGTQITTSNLLAMLGRESTYPHALKYRLKRTFFNKQNPHIGKLSHDLRVSLTEDVYNVCVNNVCHKLPVFIKIRDLGLPNS
jgi:hypothetical protein